MKKLISLTLALMLVLSLTVPAFAATTSDSEMKADGSTPISTTLDAHYTLIIPATTNIAWGATSTTLGGNEGAYGIDADPDASRLDAGKVVKITLTAGDFKCGENELTYTLSTGGYKATVAAPTSSVNVLIDTAVWDAAVSGTYNGTITFNAVYEDGTAGDIAATT